MDRNIIELRTTIEKYWKRLGDLSDGTGKDNLASTYLNNLGHTFKRIELNHPPYSIVVEEISENEVKIKDPRGEHPVTESNALGYLGFLEMFKNDLTL